MTQEEFEKLSTGQKTIYNKIEHIMTLVAEGDMRPSDAKDELFEFFDMKIKECICSTIL